MTQTAVIYAPWFGFLLWTAVFAGLPGQAAGQLQHSALLNTQAQLEVIRERVAGGEEPWTTGYSVIPSYLHHEPQPVQHYVDAGPHSERVLRHTFRQDSEAAYGSALHWIISADSAHAEKAIEILNAWAWTLRSVDPKEGGHLSTSFNWPRMIYAAEIIRTSYDGWSAADQARFEKTLTEVVWPATQRAMDKDNKNNWRSVGINCRLAIAVYMKDQQTFDETIRALRDQIGSYCYPSGQTIETARDLTHVGMGLAGLAAAAEIAWNHGIDAYGHLDNRLLTCVEWHVPHIMGLSDAEWPDTFDSPFYAPEEMLAGEPTVEMWGRRVDVREGAFDAARNVGPTWPFYELIYNHYHNRMGMEAPNTWRILTERSPVIDYANPPARMIPVRPEGASPPAGWGTLTHVDPPPAATSTRTLGSGGLLNTQKQVAFMRAKVHAAEEPWTSGYAVIPSYLDHEPQPARHYFDPAGHQGAPDDLMQPALRKDGEAAYGSALHWVVSGDSAHAEKAIEILNAWAWTLESIETRLDGPLSTSYNWPRLIYAADLIRRNYGGWSPDDEAQFERVLTEVIWDATQRAIEKDNKNNWRSVGINCRMAIAVYTGDERKFDEMLDVLRDQIGSYCYASGQSVETARDMLHTQMGLAGMVAAAEIAWNQGVDAYSHLDNRLLTCVEWHVPHIMGLPDADWPEAFDSPFYAPEEMLVGDPTVRMWGQDVDVRRGRFDAPRAVGRVWYFYEMAYNHYQNRMGLDAPNTWRILTERSPVLDYENSDDVPPIPVRPEGPSQPGGWGTLTHVRHDLISQASK